jgi:hypothetical protein
MAAVSRRLFLKNATAAGITGYAAPALAARDPALCKIERNHGEWHIKAEILSIYDDADQFTGSRFIEKFEHLPSRISFTIYVQPGETFQQAYKKETAVAEYHSDDILPMFSPLHQPDGPKPMNVFFFGMEPDGNRVAGILYEYYISTGEMCGTKKCAEPKLRSDPRHHEGWKRKRTSHKQLAGELTTLLLEADQIDVSLGYQNTPTEVTELARYTVNSVGLLDAASEMVEEQQRILADTAPETCGDPMKQLPPTGCFLTTACCTHMGRADNCAELRTLRAFRDGWLAQQPQGPELIAHYYRIAPAICRGIEGDGALLRRLYWGTILPCVVAIKLGANALALRRYRKMLDSLGATCGLTAV